jgi:hypothetical protein
MDTYAIRCFSVLVWQSTQVQNLVKREAPHQFLNFKICAFSLIKFRLRTTLLPKFEAIS